MIETEQLHTVAPASAGVRDISDGICAYLVGGLGNQLFILAAGLAQARRLGCPLYIDISAYSAGLDGRPYALDLFDLPGIVIGEDSPWFGAYPEPSAGARPLWIERAYYRHDPSIDHVTPGTTLSGYFQARAYFEPVADELAALLEGARLSHAETEQLQEIGERNAVAVHLRRGDYLNPDTARHHGLATLPYFLRSLELALKLREFDDLHVFSDSPEIAARELDGVVPAESMHLIGEGISDEASLLAMSRAKGLVMSNSSFSWWAGWLLSRRDPLAPVIAPRPWIADGASAADLLMPNWITLDAR